MRGHRVDIERLVQETFGLKIIAFHELSRRWKTYAFIDTTGKAVFVDADLIDNVQLEKKYRFTLGEELAHLLIHPSIFANCKTIEQRLAVEEDLTDVRRDRLENNARALASAILMPEATVRPFVESQIQKFTDEHGHVLVDELASATSHEYDVSRHRCFNHLNHHSELRIQGRDGCCRRLLTSDFWLLNSVNPL